MEQVRDIPIKEIYADHDFNCRGFIRGQDVVDLAASIKTEGLLQPIIVQPYTGKPGFKFRVVAGYRRFTAFKVNQSETIPALVKENLTDEQARILNLSENMKRKELNKVQEAKALEPLFLKGFTESEIAKKLGVSYGWVQIRRCILDFDEHIQTEIAVGFITDQDIRHLYSMHETKDRHEYVKEVKKQKLSGKRKADATLIKLKKAQNAKRPRERAEILDMVERLVHLGFGGSLTTVFGAWAGANVDDFTVHKKIQEACAEKGILYEIPEHIRKSAMEQGARGQTLTVVKIAD